MTKWIKVPGPGEYRGEGEWKPINRTTFNHADFDTLKRTGYLPTHEGDAPPEEAEPTDEEVAAEVEKLMGALAKKGGAANE